jgi:hypothetical protein
MLKRNTWSRFSGDVTTVKASSTGRQTFSTSMVSLREHEPLVRHICCNLEIG